jgi:hypothetical protein
MKKTLLMFIPFFSTLLFLNNVSLQAGVEQVTVRVEITETTEKDFDVFPNPSEGVFNLSLKGFENKKTELRITNVIGNLVHREILQEPDSRYVKTIDLTRFPKGVYYVKLQVDEYSEMRKIIIK